MAHRIDAAAREPGRRRRSGPHPWSGFELPCEREHLFTRGLDAVARELPRPDPGPHAGRRAAKLQREHHPPKDGLAHLAGAVHGPEGRGRRRLEQPVQVHLGARVPEGHARARTEGPPRGERIGEKVLHLVEEEERSTVPGEQALGEPKLLEAFAAHRLFALVVGFAHAVKRHVEPPGEDLAELGLARPGRAVEEDVDAGGAARERALDHPLDVVAVTGHVVEVRPIELARGRRVEEQTVHVGSRAGRSRGEPAQPIERAQVPVFVDGDETRAHEWCVRPQAGVDGVRRHAEERGQRRALDVERRHESLRRPEHVVDHRLDDGLRLVAEGKLEEVAVRAREAHRLREAAEPLRGPIRTRLPRDRVLLAQGFLKRAPFAPGHPLVATTLPGAGGRWPFPPPERHPVLAVGDPFGEVRRLPVPVVKGGGGVREVEGDQALLVRVQHELTPDSGRAVRKRLSGGYVRTGRTRTRRTNLYPGERGDARSAKGWIAG